MTAIERKTGEPSARLINNKSKLKLPRKTGAERRYLPARRAWQQERGEPSPRMANQWFPWFPLNGTIMESRDAARMDAGSGALINKETGKRKSRRKRTRAANARRHARGTRKERRNKEHGKIYTRSRATSTDLSDPAGLRFLAFYDEKKEEERQREKERKRQRGCDKRARKAAKGARASDRDGGYFNWTE